MYDDKPVIPSEWVSETSQETSTEVELLTIQPKRSKIILKINRPRRDLCNGYKFSDRDSEAGARITELSSRRLTYFSVHGMSTAQRSKL